MRAPVAALAIGLVVLLAPVAASAHSRLGEYQNMGHAPRDWQTPYPVRDGVPLVDYGSFRAANPVTAAQYGLASWSLWMRYGDRPRLRAALRVADWLVRTQRRSGEWTYEFDYTSPGTTMALHAPWGSALAQGQGVSLLRRVYEQTRRHTYVRAARRALTPLRCEVKDGGLAVARAGGLMFEEYPTERPSLPLNGHLQTLIGLYDMSDISRRARRLFRRGVVAIVRVLPEYDAGGGWSLYDLVHEVGFAPVRALPDYHAAHVRLLRLLYRLSPHAAFRVWADRWASGKLDETAEHPPGDAPRVVLGAHELPALGAQAFARGGVLGERP